MPKHLINNRYHGWYFISNRSSRAYLSTLFPIAIKLVIHVAQSEDTPENIVAGFIEFKDSHTLEDVYMTYSPLQWIPAIVGILYGSKLSVDFRKWERDDFEATSLLGGRYPWNRVFCFVHYYHEQVIEDELPSDCEEEFEVQEDTNSDLEV